MRILFFSFIFLISESFATTFVPIPLKEMIKSSNAMVEGEVLFSRVELLDKREIVTITTVELNRWSGIEGKKTIEVYTPGGTLEEETLLIEGSPIFKEGEKIFLFLKEFNSRYWVSNLSLGTYRFKKLGSNKMLVNSVFPYHPEIGQISPSKLYALAERIKNVKFEKKPRDKYQVMRENLKSSKVKTIRKIASTDQEVSEEKTSESTNIYWLLAILAFIGAIWTLKRQRE